MQEKLLQIRFGEAIPESWNRVADSIRRPGSALRKP